MERFVQTKESIDYFFTNFNSSIRLQACLQQTSDAMPCPPNPFEPSGTGRYLAICQGGSRVQRLILARPAYSLSAWLASVI